MPLLLLITVLVSSAFADSEVYRFGNKHIYFHTVEGVQVNRTCTTEACLAIILSKKFKGKYPAKDQLRGGKNPYSVKCVQMLGGTSEIGLDKNGHEQSFCRLTDDSYINSSTL